MSQPPSDDLKIVVIEIDPLKNKEAGDAESLGVHNHAKVLRKLDWHILPLISALYLVCSLDRASLGKYHYVSNAPVLLISLFLGNAKIAGMETDLELVGLRYNTVVAIFFAPYCLAQVPSNILLKFFRPSRWIPMIMAAWGLTMTLMCLVTTYRELLIARVFLGLAEAGLFPGVIFYISFWYPRAERAKRLAIFASTAIAAGAFSGLLSSVIIRMEGLGGLHGWQWIFCLEGIVTFLTALVTPFFIYDRVETASFLTESERRYVVKMLKADLQGLATHYDFRFILQALKDYKIFMQLGIFLCLVIPTSGIAFFTPTIISELKFSVTDTQLLSAPPYVAGCISTVLVGIYSDKLRLRGPFVVGGALVGLVGFVILYTQTSPGASLVGIVLGLMGIFSSMHLAVAWATTNVGGEVKRSVAIAMISGFGNLGGVCSVFLFFDPPRFHVAIAIIITLLCLVIPLTLFVMWNYNKINKQRELECRLRGITDDQMDDFRDCGDDSPLFRYTI